MMEREAKILLRKELRQMLSSKAVVVSSLLVPTLMLLVIPNFVLFTSLHAPNKPHATNGPPPSIGLVADVGNDPKRIVVALLPLFISMVGIILPMLFTTHLVINERERRTLELLVALPVRIQEVMRAKLLAVVIATSAAIVPMVTIDAVAVLVTGVGTLRDVIGLPVLVVCVIAYATTAALLVALVAKDFRTANNVAGFVLLPSIFVTLAAVTILPGGVARPLLLGGVFFCAAFVMLRVALRVVTFERLLS